MRIILILFTVIILFPINIGEAALNFSPTGIVERIDHMSLDEKIGQVIIIGMDGTAVDDRTKTFITEKYVSGLIFFKKNIESSEQFLELTNSLKQVPKKIPLIMSIDEEGGKVTRMPSEIKAIPSSRIIGSKKNREIARQVGYLLGKEMALFGLNMDFAPVLDINTNSQNPIIGSRSFSADKEWVSILGVEVMKGIQQEGNVVSVVKHFPGHGDTSVDSHKGLPVISYPLERVDTVELYPFKRAISEQVEAIMVGHLLIPAFDLVFPSSLSKKIMTNVLREKLNFEGVIVTDDMTMGALDEYTIDERVVKALAAGADLVLVCHGTETVNQAITGIKKAVQDGHLSEKVLNTHVYRILQLKEKYKMNNNLVKMGDIQELNRQIERLLQ